MYNTAQNIYILQIANGKTPLKLKRLIIYASTPSIYLLVSICEKNKNTSSLNLKARESERKELVSRWTVDESDVCWLKMKRRRRRRKEG